jgi:DNA-binding transcriptional regulator YdaS (Cro superfamily)
MTPADLRAICDSLNVERGMGGQSKLARLLGWRHSTVWRKLNGASPITKADELAIRRAVEGSIEQSGPWPQDFPHTDR